MVDLGEITLIVTGFPRSGTSMAMRMLELGGVKILADSAHREEGDSSKFNPHGIWELSNLSDQLQAHDSEWTKNQAIKIVTPYAIHFPFDRPLKAIFMQRDTTEIITSLLAMKTIWGEDILKSLNFARQSLIYNEVPILFIKHKEMVDYPKTTAMRIQDFLGVELDIDSMVKAVDRNARNRYKDDPSILGHDMPDAIIRTDPEPYSKLHIYNRGNVSDILADGESE